MHGHEHGTGKLTKQHVQECDKKKKIELSLFATLAPH